MKFRPNAHLHPSQVIDRRDATFYMNPFGLHTAHAPINPVLLGLLANANRGGRGPVYVPGGLPFPWVPLIGQEGNRHAPPPPPGNARTLHVHPIVHAVMHALGHPLP